MLSSTETDCQFAHWFADQHLPYMNHEWVSRSKEIVRIVKTTYPSEKEGELFLKEMQFTVYVLFSSDRVGGTGVCIVERLVSLFSEIIMVDFFQETHIKQCKFMDIYMCDKKILTYGNKNCPIAVLNQISINITALLTNHAEGWPETKIPLTDGAVTTRLQMWLSIWLLNILLLVFVINKGSFQDFVFSHED